ncbi:MAG: hypothetical protein K2H01_05305 [Ruminococcus sp.]|nr:hypothetical protein [Ruminococcus sp.]
MKKLIIFIVFQILVFPQLICPILKAEHIVKGKNEFSIDSMLFNTLKNNNFILWTTNHYCVDWVILLRNDTSYYFLSAPISNPIPKWKYDGFDTIQLIKDNLPIIEWGFDTLGREGFPPASLPSNYSRLIINELYVFDKNFKLRAKFLTSGKNEEKYDEIFSKKLHTLSYLLFWVGESYLRDVIPAPDFER